MAKKAIHIYYSGRVQGVGFRFTVESIALRLSLVGWVRNLSDGRVEVLCEGDQDQLVVFLDDVKHSAVGRYITGETVTWMEPTNQFSDFTIRFF